MSVEHCFDLLQCLEAIEDWHVYVQENERDWVQGSVTWGIAYIDIAQHHLKGFNDVLAIIRALELISDS